LRSFEVETRGGSCWPLDTQDAATPLSQSMPRGALAYAFASARAQEGEQLRRYERKLAHPVAEGGRMVTQPDGLATFMPSYAAMTDSVTETSARG